uniref:Cyclin-dependent kinase inhibitor 1B n=1 Tax=Leptobrachium leishanense TaxID=445787 RepID=A0A8C5N0M6_9ANUR
MSGVSLSPGSPGVERVSRAPGSPRAPTRRRLFGAMDHENLSRDLDRCRRELEGEQQQRWNFDFANDRPLNGPFEWEPAGPDTPEFYRREPHPRPVKRSKLPREPQAKPGPEEQLDSQGRKRSGEAMDSSSPTLKRSNRIEAGETTDSRVVPSPEQTPQKKKPST